jgi:hypothetical protein
VASFNITDFLDTVVGRIGKTEGGEGGRIKDFNGFLVEIKYGPLCGK